MIDANRIDRITPSLPFLQDADPQLLQEFRQHASPPGRRPGRGNRFVDKCCCQSLQY